MRHAGDDREPELYLVHRSPRLRFLGGFHAFPGGKLDPADQAHPDGTPLSAQRRAAVRELFEETGILLVPAPGDVLAWRRGLLDGSRSFADLYPAPLDPATLSHAGNLVTPPFSPQRFDTAFFVATCPANQVPEVWPGELDSGRWITARAALAEWHDGLLLSPPTVALFAALVGKTSREIVPTCIVETTRIMASDLPLWFAPGVGMIPHLAPALPPAQYTNAFLVGHAPRYLIDPGATDPDEQARLCRLLDAELAHVPLTAVIVSHHHIDHVGAARVVADRYRVPILAHPDAARRLGDSLTIDRHISDGERLGEMVALLTPGHAPGHLAFHLPRFGMLLAGDMVSTLSSVIVAPPDGNLRHYTASLRRLLALPLRLLLPSHGGPSARPDVTLQTALDHRSERERQLLTALESGPRSMEELVAEVYRGVPRELWHLAALQLRGNLEALREEGVVAERGEQWLRN